MMLDPMFMIVQRKRSLLTVVAPTAVTSTAVTSIVVILPDFNWIYLNISDFFKIYLNLP